ncbi:MAG TPA: response regulator transcription factor [Methylibium sp.]|uniref:response regulator transcription factor n=1 Tax=Methylibium sp. TaxID=2067992 RepID=UPI002DB57388|nr:response regulator transcription factor [Methylibium sp.]HEU4459069.1 response regulator transcription factor [Methylibium sp.]
MSVKVLIVEDNPVARQFLTRVVRESFSDVSGIGEAGDLESARRMLGVGGAAPLRDGAERYKLVLVDLELPDGNGLDLLKDLNGHPATRIVTTLYSDDDHLFPALQNGADGYLLKEDRFEVLVEALQKIVRGEPPLSPAIARRMMSHFRLGESQLMPLDAPRHEFKASRPQAAVYAEPDHERLTPRETEVLTYLSKGFTIKEIAGLIGIKWFTVNDHIKAIYRKLNVSSRAEAAVLASKQGLV